MATGTRYQAVYALVASWTLIIIYLWVRFQGVAFGLAAVIALIHDVLVMLGGHRLQLLHRPLLRLGLTLIEPFKINLPIVAAFLTIIGYSVNDTIVVFDRIREVRGKDPRMTRQMVNDSTNQTLSRTLLTSFTVLLVVVILYLVGGAGDARVRLRVDDRRVDGDVQFDLRGGPDPAVADPSQGDAERPVGDVPEAVSSERIGRNSAETQRNRDGVDAVEATAGINSAARVGLPPSALRLPPWNATTRRRGPPWRPCSGSIAPAPPRAAIGRNGRPGGPNRASRPTRSGTSAPAR